MAEPVRPTAPRAEAAPPPDTVAPATVVASTSCLEPEARDQVLVDVGGARRQVPLDACGSPVGAVVMVRLAGDDPAAPARLLGTGGAGPVSADGGSEPSPTVERLSITLAVVAALGAAGLLVAVARERRGRTAGTRVP